MIFHELCHSLVQGTPGLAAVDWGLSNLTDADVVREHATLRLQAALSGTYGLARVLAPTTDFRAYYDALTEEPLVGDEPCVRLARAAFGRVDTPPWGPHVRDALAATARVIGAVREVGAAETVPDGTLPSLFALFTPPSDKERT
jgi:hypothetical protein